ncbi:uncharacterized protein VP01_8776g1 [Puccinia sorghi]|uniref:Uncharacterized protein n=1 Tax=Puccinia sorghi TaxID=27349 RepID=A0A0L6U997_9BASI|nr:uncharacterized protein VP01_8776g1 [Puccinia sorghi]
MVTGQQGCNRINSCLGPFGKTMPIKTLQMYLTQAALPGHPWAFSAWTHMRQIENYWDFVMVMGVNVWTFEAILVPFSTVCHKLIDALWIQQVDWPVMIL